MIARHMYTIAFLALAAFITSGFVGPAPRVHTIFCNAQKEAITPQNTIFAFDFHGVITKSHGWPKWQTRFDILWNSPCRNTIFKYSPMLLYTLYTLRNQLNSAEKTFEQIVELYPALAPCQDTFLEIANAQQANEGTQAIMKALKEQGFNLYLFSNIGEKTFQDLKTRRPHLIQYLDPNQYTIVRAANNYVAKPDLRMYEQFMQECNPENKQVIFIDDLKENITAGCKTNMISILFRTPEQLRRDLGTLGIELKEEPRPEQPSSSGAVPFSKKIALWPGK